MARLPSRVTQSASGVAPSAVPYTRVPSAPIAREQTSDRQANAAQESQRVSAARASTNPLGDGVLFTTLALKSAVPYVINHGLGAPYSGWIITRIRRAASGPTFLEQPPVSEGLQLIIQASVDCTVDVWVFK